jgi:hypothetical protein
MLDVHAPHKPFENFKEFLLHIFTITVGLLIATQIESCMEWRHHVHLADEARTSLREEIEQNLKDLQQDGPSLQKWRQEITDDLNAMDGIRANPNDPAAQHSSLSVMSHAITLRDTAWKTAQATGALAYMPYDEAQSYARIYKAQDDLNALQLRPAEDVARIFGLIRRFDWGPKSHITPDQASQMSDLLGQMQLHLPLGSAVFNENLEVNQAFVEGRKPKDNFTETLK